jgi:hypothetical protein
MARWIKKHFKELFSRLGVVSQSSVCETESIVAADGVQHAAAVQRPEPQMLDEKRDDGSGFNRRVTWKRFNPTDVELLPLHERRSRSIEIRSATPNRDDCLVEVSEGRFAVHDANGAVREWPSLRVVHEAVNCLLRWTSNEEHRCLSAVPNSASHISRQLQLAGAFHRDVGSSARFGTGTNYSIGVSDDFRIREM